MERLNLNGVTLVTASSSDRWGVSYTTGTGIKGVILNVYRFPEGLAGKIESCSECDGHAFQNHDDATAQAFHHGHLFPFQDTACKTSQRLENWRIRVVKRQVSRLKSLRAL